MPRARLFQWTGWKNCRMENFATGSRLPGDVSGCERKPDRAQPQENGTNHADFEPLDFIAKLVALIPSPRIHMVRFHGLLGPAAKWRSSIIPQAATGQAASPDTDVPIGKNASNADPTGKQETADPPKAQGRNYTWCELMKRVFAADVLACAHCGGRLRILSVIRPPEIARKILDHLGLPSRPPPVAAPACQELPFAFE
jgi:hypothetical protein